MLLDRDPFFWRRVEDLCPPKGEGRDLFDDFDLDTIT